MLHLCACVAQLLQQLPAERVEQKEIPAEHMILKTTFDSLVQRCQLAAGDPVSFNLWERPTFTVAAAAGGGGVLFFYS